VVRKLRYRVARFTSLTLVLRMTVMGVLSSRAPRIAFGGGALRRGGRVDGGRPPIIEGIGVKRAGSRPPLALEQDFASSGLVIRG